jgi:hypothetical protein
MSDSAVNDDNDNRQIHYYGCNKLGLTIAAIICTTILTLCMWMVYRFGDYNLSWMKSYMLAMSAMTTMLLTVECFSACWHARWYDSGDGIFVTEQSESVESFQNRLV